jgi:predicted metalloprotease
MPSRLLACLVALLCAVATAGCGGDELAGLERDARDTAEELQESAERVRERAERLRERAERLADRIRETLADIRRSVPSASLEQPRSEGRAQAGGRVANFLTEVLTSVDTYWTRTLQAAGQPEPRVGYVWVQPGARVGTECGAVADDAAAFYCPASDTIYIAEVFAERVWRGVADEFPGTQAGAGRAIGDFGLAYVVAHEYAHNLQHELGFFSLRPGRGNAAFELQADCMAGVWGNSVYRAGELQPGDVEEAVSTALAVGDFEFGSAGHHGTPTERRDAWLLGFRDGQPSDCSRYVPT